MLIEEDLEFNMGFNIGTSGESGHFMGGDEIASGSVLHIDAGDYDSRTTDFGTKWAALAECLDIPTTPTFFKVRICLISSSGHCIFNILL